MPAGSTYTPIATTTADGTSNTVTFSSIAGTYTDLVLIGGNVNSASAGNTPFIRFNSDSGTNYSGTILEGNGTSAQSGRRTNNSNGVPIGGTFVGSNSTAYNFIVSIMNYANTTTYKTTLARYNNSAAETEADVGLWRSTAAITSLTIRTDGGANWSSGSTFTLYGIASA